MKKKLIIWWNVWKRCCRIPDSRGLHIADATPSSGELAADGDGRNGLYTKHLIHHIQKSGLVVEEVFKNVRVAVVLETANKQIPWESFSLMGTFYFDSGPQIADSVSQPAVNQQPTTGSYEIVFWESIKDSTNADEFAAYLLQYPDGAFAPLARIRLASIDPNIKDPDIITRDGQYVKYRNGIVHDTKTGLEWVAGPEATKSHDGARYWVSRLDLDGGSWRMPSIEELKSLYQSGAGEKNMTSLIETDVWHIFSQDSSRASLNGFIFKASEPFAFGRYHDFVNYNYYGVAFRAFAVRSRR